MLIQRMKPKTRTRDETSFRHGQDGKSADQRGFACGIRLLIRGIFPRWFSLLGERRPQPRPVMLLVIPLSVPHGDRKE